MNRIIGFAILLIIGILGCKKDDPSCTDCPTDQIIGGDYNPQSFTINVPDWLEQSPIVPADNPMTVEGVDLGRHLFYDPILSSDSTRSCASCHQLDKAFSDGAAVSFGVLGIPGTRSSMPLFNLAFNNNGFFWDGRVATLEEQALLPVEDHIELNENWDNVIEKFVRHPDYPKMFRAAFGIDRTSEITKELAVKAIAQFERSIVSLDSREDQITRFNNGWPTAAEKRGRALFFIEPSTQDDNHPGCSHCHMGFNLTDNAYKNNGLDNVSDLQDFPDLGLGGFTNNVFENGKFRVPSLRNIALTAPYMHDGRFSTLEEVLDHYASGGHGVENEDPNIRPFPLSEQDKSDLIAFMNMLTDTAFVNNPVYKNPFEE